MKHWNKISVILPILQFMIALYTLSQILSLEPKNPIYLCTIPTDSYGNLFEGLVCSPQ